MSAKEKLYKFHGYRLFLEDNINIKFIKGNVTLTLHKGGVVSKTRLSNENVEYIVLPTPSECLLIREYAKEIGWE